ncbi:MAG: 1-deoxy-D-xylulose-5-phosphate synthase N-terminal domain-containing protein, partial [Thermoanaerobaculia bacterium]
MSPLRPTPLLDKVNWPRDLRMLAEEKLPQLADELRTFVIDTV